MVSVGPRPEPHAQLWHYHRPHREAWLRRPSVVSVHHDPRDTHFWLRFHRFLPRWREADRIICLNETQKRLLGAHGLEHTIVIPHGVDRAVLPLPSVPRRFTGAQIRLGLVSKRYDRGVKGEALLGALLRRLDPRHFSLVMAGEGRWHAARLARQLGFGVESYESLPYRLFGQLYAGIDLLLVPSEFEGGPACLMEALGTGTPVAATAVGMVPDWLVNGANGVILSGDPDADAQSLTALAENGGALLNRLAEGAFATASTVPGWQEVLDRYFAVYHTIAS